MKIGTAKIDITPPVGVDLTGFVARLHPSDNVADKLYARTLEIAIGGDSAVLISVDLLAVGQGFVERIRQRLKVLGRLPGDIIVCASHTHSGPATVTLRECGRIMPGYLAYLEDRVIDSVLRAHECLSQCEMLYSEVAAEGLSRNRRRPDGPIDETIRVMKFVDNLGRIHSYIVNYACHGVCMCSSSISGDYISHVSQTLEGTLEEDVPALFLTGPSGDINPVASGREAAIDMGQNIARKILNIPDDKWKRVECKELRMASKKVLFPFSSLPSHHELAKVVSANIPGLMSDDELSRKISRAMIGWALSVSRKVDEGITPIGEIIEVSALRVGEAVILGLPGEIFTGIGTQIRKRFNNLTLMIAAHSNGTAGYVPSGDEYDKGGYELEAYRWYDYPAVLAPEASDILIECAVSLIDETAIGNK